MTDYIKLIKPDNTIPMADIRKNYLKLVKENHPDLFPESERIKQNLILMEINEAYLIALSNKKLKEDIREEQDQGKNNHNPIELHKNPDYAYYRTAIRLYQEAQYIFNKIIIGYPNSIWKDDAFDKLKNISKLNERYNVILNNNFQAVSLD